ncbi:glycoside hydrolase family 28 protein [Caldicellulosiruptoraceae bacterium PP1]
MKYYITDFGAIGDGITINTDAIQKTIDKCFENGGGIVVIPQGTFVSMPIELKSNVTLHIENGGILKASPNIEHYKNIGYYHNEFGEVTSFLYCMHAKNISIEGHGIIDLSGKSFMDFSQIFNQFEEFAYLSPEEIEEVECKPLKRPNQPIFFFDCENISIKNIKIIDSPCWTVCIHSSCNIKINNVFIDNNLRVPNNDGIHVCSSTNVIITNCIFTCGDDCIAISGITNWDRPCENISISNCIMRTRSKAIAIGHLDSKVKNVTINNVIINDSNRGIHIFANAKTGWVKSVNISNVIAQTKIFAGTWWGKGEPIVIAAPEEGNYIEDIKITNFKANSENGIVIVGNGNNVKNVVLKDIELKIGYSKHRRLFTKFFDIRPSEPIYFDNYMQQIPWIFARKVNGLTLEYISYGIDKDNSENQIYSLDSIFEEVYNAYIDNIRTIE